MLILLVVPPQYLQPISPLWNKTQYNAAVKAQSDNRHISEVAELTWQISSNPVLKWQRNSDEGTSSCSICILVLNIWLLNIYSTRLIVQSMTFYADARQNQLVDRDVAVHFLILRVQTNVYAPQVPFSGLFYVVTAFPAHRNPSSKLSAHLDLASKSINSMPFHRPQSLQPQVFRMIEDRDAWLSECDFQRGVRWIW